MTRAADRSGNKPVVAPFKKRKAAFIALSVVLAAWLLFLAAMILRDRGYFSS